MQINNIMQFISFTSAGHCHGQESKLLSGPRWADFHTQGIQITTVRRLPYSAQCLGQESKLLRRLPYCTMSEAGIQISRETVMGHGSLCNNLDLKIAAQFQSH